MAAYDFSAPRLFVPSDLRAGAQLTLEHDQRNYLCNVLRLKQGSEVLVFNGRDGEWRAVLAKVDRKRATLSVASQARPQSIPGDLRYLFAPLKHARLDYMVQKAVEMGASALQPVITRHTQVQRVNLERLAANAIEAAEQCGILAVPSVHPPRALAAILADWEPDRTLVFCDEDAEAGDPVAALRAITIRAALGLLVGPEGGFDAEERAALVAVPGMVRLSLGPRILRADTAAVAALALIQATAGDWR